MEYIDFARIQIDKAIELYFQDEYICAITLAGAGEEIAGKIAKYSKNKENILEELASKIIINKPSIEKKEIVESLNRPRNMLKHFVDKDGLNFKPVDDSVFVIFRAIINYILATDKKTKSMDRFLNDQKFLLVLESAAK